SQEALDAAAGHVLEVARNSREGTRRPRSAGEGVDLAVRLRPNLGARSLDVGAAVGGVVELVRPDGIVEALGVAAGLVVVVVRVVEGDGGDGVDLGAEEAE